MEASRRNRPNFDHHRRSQLLALILLPILLLAVTSCLRRKEPVLMLGNEGVTLEGAANLTCSEQCRGSGQCGTIDTAWVILASSAGPATQSHDLTFPDGAAVTILGHERLAVQSISDPSKDDLWYFYAINVPEQGNGWIAGWCISQLVVP